MLLGTNVLKISNVWQNEQVAQLLNFLKVQRRDLPTQCSDIYVLDNRIFITYNNHITYIIDQLNNTIVKAPCSGQILYVERGLGNQIYNIYYLLDRQTIICDEIQGYNWDRENNSEHGVRVNRRKLQYNCRHDISNVSSSDNYLVITTKTGEIFLVDKKDIVSSTDNRICRTVAQVASVDDYLNVPNLIAPEVAALVNDYSYSGTMLDSVLKENEDGQTMTLYVMVLVENSPDIIYNIFAHTIETKTLSVRSHEYYGKYSVHECRQCSEDYSVSALMEVLNYFRKTKMQNVKVIHCSRGTGGFVYVSYYNMPNPSDEDGEIDTRLHSLIFKQDEQGRLKKWFYKPFEDPALGSFLVKHVLELPNDEKMLLAASPSSIEEDEDEPSIENLVPFGFIKLDKNNEIIEYYSGEINRADLVFLLSCNSIDQEEFKEFYDKETSLLDEEESEQLEEDFSKAMEDVMDDVEMKKQELDQQEAEEEEEEDDQEEDQEEDSDDDDETNEDTDNDDESLEEGDNADADSKPEDAEQENKDFFLD